MSCIVYLYLFIYVYSFYFKIGVGKPVLHCVPWVSSSLALEFWALRKLEQIARKKQSIALLKVGCTVLDTCVNLTCVKYLNVQPSDRMSR